MKFVHLEKGWKDEGILFSSLFLKKKEKKITLKIDGDFSMKNLLAMEICFNRTKL